MKVVASFATEVEKKLSEWGATVIDSVVRGQRIGSSVIGLIILAEGRGH